ncbi:ornithine carbamoyltransferase [Pseudomonas sp. ANT_J12]|uniref:ornithine carbamoyltransferase n=1 Tax=Pseudomonas sp. ANT_J12 TaxID=2597351 RepID=UPI0011F28871|nr:ornithine carbamoyltransferase [Pseudomonas sp. ANT_J12]KAA0982170.1 ornithine carbamoyltransferase [Pseudomonas sp. ANT_J12]
MNIISLKDLTARDILEIWTLSKQPAKPCHGTVGWSFEGNGIRTRTTFIQAFGQLGLEFIELPNLLKSRERTADLAGYIDPFYSIYVIRESNHQRLMEFASASKRPVINAMSTMGHPCEVLSDGFYIHSKFGDIRRPKIGLWGPTTNVMRSWHELAEALGIVIVHFCGENFHDLNPSVSFSDVTDRQVDILITDSWPASYTGVEWSLTEEHLRKLGNPILLPTPPFFIGEEISFDPIGYAGFAGYEQKGALLQVQRAIVEYAIRA